MPPMEPFPQGPENSMSQASDEAPQGTLEDMADAVEEGHLPERDG